MSIIKCPECRGQVSTMAGTCPHCGTSISGHLRTCPQCGGACLVHQDKCPECGSTLTRTPSPTPPAKTEARKESQPPRRNTLMGAAATILLILACTGYYFYDRQRKEQKEQADYERLLTVTNPEFCQQFLIDYPESKHYDEINGRMLRLQEEANEWKQLQAGITRAAVTRFMQKHPQSLRRRACEDMIDSIDWQDAQAIGSEEALQDYLTRHPSGRYASEAAEKKNALLLAKVTSSQHAMIRGTLEAFFSNAIARQDTAAARAAIPDTMASFCGTPNATAETIVRYAAAKMEKDVIGIHYLIGQQMNVCKESLQDGSTGFAVEVSLQETISRSDTNMPSSNLYRVTALINQDQKIVRMNISK